MGLPVGSCVVDVFLATSIGPVAKWFEGSRDHSEQLRNWGF